MPFEREPIAVRRIDIYPSHMRLVVVGRWITRKEIIFSIWLGRGAGVVRQRNVLEICLRDGVDAQPGIRKYISRYRAPHHAGVRDTFRRSTDSTNCHNSGVRVI